MPTPRRAARGTVRTNWRRSRRHPPGWCSSRQFRSPLIFILLAALAVTVLLGEHLDAAVIAAVLVLNAVIGFTQERKAEGAVLALMQLVVPHARVVRDGRDEEIDSRDLVPGRRRTAGVRCADSGRPAPRRSERTAGRRVAADGRVGVGHQDRRAGGTRSAAGGPVVHGLHRCDGHRGPRARRGRRHRVEHRTRRHRRPDAIRDRGGHTAAAADGSLRPDHRDRRRTGGGGCVRQRRRARRTGRGHVPRRGGAGGVRRARGPSRGGHHHARRRGSSDGEAQRDRPATPGGRDAGQHDGDRLGQDRHAHREPDDRRGDLDARPSLHPRRGRSRRRVPRRRRTRGDRRPSRVCTRPCSPASSRTRPTCTGPTTT